MVDSAHPESIAGVEDGSDQCGLSGHKWEPVSEGEDRNHEPMIATAMVCLNCDDRKPVEDGDLDGYSGAYAYPETSGDGSEEAE